MFSAATISPKQQLFNLLDQITEDDVKTLHAEYLAAPDKQVFFAEFENPGGKKPVTRDLFLFEKWLHYRWTAIALSFLGYQKQQLIKRAEYNNYLAASAEEQREENKNQLLIKQAVYQEYLATTTEKTPLPPVFFNPEIPEAVLFNPAIPETIADVIQQDKINKISFEESIAKLRKICLQIVGTEHPTDPLSQEAHDVLSDIANEFVTGQPSNEKLIALLKKFQAADPIPAMRREVHEEVNRDKKATAIRFYDNLPVFTQHIFDAYNKYYGIESTATHQNIIWQALEGGLQPDGKNTSPIASDVSWAAGDAEGNPNVDPPAMRVAIADNRKMAAEKHSETIQRIIINAKSHERDLRDAIPELHDDKFDSLLKLTNDLGIIKSFQRFQTAVSRYLIHRDFGGLVKYYAAALQELNVAIDSAVPNPTAEQHAIINDIRGIFDKQASLAAQLYELTLFSGSYKDSFSPDEDIKSGQQLAEGALSKFQRIFQEIINKVGKDKNSDFIKQNNLPAMLKHLDQILQNHALVMRDFPDINRQMRDFRLQLLCFRMGLGYMHVRQDSSVLMNIWDLLLNDVKPDASRFLKMSDTDQAELMETLLDNSTESKQLLETIYLRWKTQHYNDKAFEDVCRELERMELALTNPDIFEVWIMSNTRKLSNILTLLVFKKIFPEPLQHNPLHIVPLLENLQDLRIAPEILEKYIRILIVEDLRKHEACKHIIPGLSKLSYDEFIHAIKPFRHLISTRVEGMFGYSDSSRGSGLSTLLEVYVKEEMFIDIANSYGIEWRIFDGSGGDLFRGGSHLARRQQKFTGQGNFRDNEYGTPITADYFRQSQFANSYMDLTQGKLAYKDLRSYALKYLEQFCKTSADYFENFLDTETGKGVFPGLTFGWGANFLVKMANPSSRGNIRALTVNGLIQKNHSDPSMEVQTGGKDNEGFIDPAPLRAIGASQLYEMLRLYMHIIIGPGQAMRSLVNDPTLAEEDNLARCAAIVKSLYFLCPPFQDVYEKMLYGLAAVKFEIAFDAYFMDRPDLRPANPDQRAEWLKKAKSYDGKYTKASVKEKLKTVEGKEELLVALSRVFVLIEDEFYKTRDFLAQTSKMIFAEKYRHNKLAKITENIDLLHHNPELAEHMQELWQNAEPLNWLLARISHHLAHNRKLDWVYNVSKDVKVTGSKLSIIARILGDIATGIVSSRILLLTVDVQRPILSGRLNMQKEYAALAPYLPVAAKFDAKFTEQLASAKTHYTLKLYQSYGLFNAERPQEQKIEPFAKLAVRSNGYRH